MGFIQDNQIINSIGHVRIKSFDSGKYLDVYGHSIKVNGKIVQWDQNQQENQFFVLERVIELNYVLFNVFYIRCLQNSLYLTIYNQSQEDLASLVQDHLQPLKDNHHQRFVIENLQNGNVMIQAFHSKKYLDVKGGSKDNGAEIVQWPKHCGFNQQFIIIKN